MGVRTHHHTARKSIVLQYHLVDDACTRLPETNAVAGRDIAEKVVDFLIGLCGGCDVCLRSLISLNQMVAMYRRRDCHLLPSGIHELQQSHLRRRILHCYTIGAKVYIILSPFIVLHFTLII